MKALSPIAIIVFLFTGFNVTSNALTDSIGYFYKGDQKVIIYEVNKGETLTSISNKYSLELDVIKEYNPNIKKGKIKAGQIVKIPYISTVANTSVSEPGTAGNLIEHTVESGETLYAISRKYNVSASKIFDANPNIDVSKISIGQIILIPSGSDLQDEQIDANTMETAPVETEGEGIVGDETANIIAGTAAVAVVGSGEVEMDMEPEVGIDRESSDEPKTDTANAANKVHLVLAGETMYGISRKYGIKVTDIMEWNQLKDFSIKEGQSLIVGLGAGGQTYLDHGNQTAVAVTAVTGMASTSNYPVSGTENILALQYKENKSSNFYMETDETGIAAWIKDVDGYPVQNGFFSLHKSLPIGTIMKVRNMMNNRIIYAKVIGRLPDSDSNRKLLIKLPESAKRQLNVLDDQLVMEVKYLKRVN